MIPKEFYKEPVPLYTEDFDTEIYSTTQQANSYRVDIRYVERNCNDTYFLKIFGMDGKPLNMNGWIFIEASFHVAWNYNYSPSVTIKAPERILYKYRLGDSFAKKEYNRGGEIESRLREIFHFMEYISQFQSLYDFETVHGASLSNIDDVIRFYLECLKT